MSFMKKSYLVCMAIFAVGTLLRIALHPEGRLLPWLVYAPDFFLVLGMLAWAQTWREWK
jgi:hypothetical protein